LCTQKTEKTEQVRIDQREVLFALSIVAKTSLKRKLSLPVSHNVRCWREV